MAKWRKVACIGMKSMAAAVAAKLSK